MQKTGLWMAVNGSDNRQKAWSLLFNKFRAQVLTVERIQYF